MDIFAPNDTNMVMRDRVKFFNTYQMNFGITDGITTGDFVKTKNRACYSAVYDFKPLLK